MTSGPKSNFICDSNREKPFCFSSASTWLITFELANQRERKVLFTLACEQALHLGLTRDLFWARAARRLGPRTNPLSARTQISRETQINLAQNKSRVRPKWRACSQAKVYMKEFIFELRLQMKVKNDHHSKFPI